MSMRNLALATAAVAVLGLAGCGQTKSDRALSGAGIGAATGAAGAAAGYLSDPDDVNLGRPLWRR